MKRIRNVLIVLLGVITLTGCSMKTEYNMNITSEGKVNFGIIAAMDKEMIKAMMSMGETAEGTQTAEPTDEDMKNYLYNNSDNNEEETRKEAEKAGFTLERYAEGEYIGYKYTTSIENINTISGDTDVTFDITKITESETPLSQQKMFKKSGNTYTATFTFNPNAMTSTADNTGTSTDDNTGTDTATGETTGADLSQYLENVMFDYQFVVTLPVAATSNNATSVSEDGKTLTWKLDSKTIGNVNFAFDLEVATATTGDTETSATGNGLPAFLSFIPADMVMPAIIGVVAVIVLIILVIVIVSNKKKKNLEPMETPTTDTVNTTVEAALDAVPSPVDSTVVEGEVPIGGIEVGTPTEVSTETPVEAPTPVEMPTPVVETQPEVVAPAPVEVPTTPVVETPVVEEAPVEGPTPVMPTDAPAPVEEVVTPTETIETVTLDVPAQTPVAPVEEVVAPAQPAPTMDATPVFETPAVEVTPTENVQ